MAAEAANNGVDMTIITSKTKEVVTATWPAVAERWTEIATAIFDRWFQHHPELQTLFYGTPDAEDVVKDAILLLHFQRVKGVLEVVVKTIMDIDKLSKTAERLGERHAKYGAKAAHVKAFKESFMASVSDIMQCGEEILNAWENLIVFVLHHFVIGLNSAIQASSD